MRRVARRRAYRALAGLVCALSIVATAAASTADGPCRPGHWATVWSDEFDGTDLDQKKWNIGHWYEHDNLRIVTHAVSGGYLRLYPRVDGHGELISRTLTTDGKYFLPNKQKYCVEFKARLPAGRGRWPALWLFGHDDSLAPSRPELDMMETGTTPPWGNGEVPLAIKATSWTDLGMSPFTHKPIGQRGQHSEPRMIPELSVRDHLFAALVDPLKQTVTYYVDGEQFALHALDSTQSRLYLVISDQYNGAFNGSSPADPTATVATAVPFLVDYVRVAIER
jgi:beta-glucanase (GH16 family)